MKRNKTICMDSAGKTMAELKKKTSEINIFHWLHNEWTHSATIVKSNKDLVKSDFTEIIKYSGGVLVVHERFRMHMLFRYKGYIHKYKRMNYNSFVLTDTIPLGDESPAFKLMDLVINVNIPKIFKSI